MQNYANYTIAYYIYNYTTNFINASNMYKKIEEAFKPLLLFDPGTYIQIIFS